MECRNKAGGLSGSLLGAVLQVYLHFGLSNEGDHRPLPGQDSDG